MEANTFTEDQVLEMYMLFDKMVSVHRLVSNMKRTKAIAKKMLNKSSFPALILVFKQAMTDNTNDEDLAQWVVSFFAGIDGKGASVSVAYNESVSSQTSSRENVQKRHNAIMSHYRAYVASINNTDNASAYKGDY